MPVPSEYVMRLGLKDQLSRGVMASFFEAEVTEPKLSRKASSENCRTVPQTDTGR